MGYFDSVKLCDVLSHFSQRSTLEIQIKGESHDFRVIVALEKALICYEPLAACAAFEAWLLALSCFAVSPLEQVNGVAETAMLETENSLR
jgi:hypothetical protein